MKRTLLTALALAMAIGCRPKEEKPPVDAGPAEERSVERELERLKRHLPAWAYYDGHALADAVSSLEAFDIVAIAPESIDEAAVKRLRESGAEVHVDPPVPAPEFGKDVFRFAGGLCWFDFDPESLRRSDPRSAECGPEFLRVLAARQENRSIRLLALSRRDMDAAEWKAYERVCRSLGFIPYAAPKGADRVCAAAHAVASDVPRR